MSSPFFDHEKLNVYNEAIGFIKWQNGLFSKIKINAALKQQMERAAYSVVLNIAEGNGKFTSADRCRFFDIAKGSVLESSAALDIIVAQGQAETGEVQTGKEMLQNVFKM